MLDSLLSRSNQADTTDPPSPRTAPNRTRRTNPHRRERRNRLSMALTNRARTNSHSTSRSDPEEPTAATHPWVPRKRGRPDAHRGAWPNTSPRSKTTSTPDSWTPSSGSVCTSVSTSVTSRRWTTRASSSTTRQGDSSSFQRQRFSAVRGTLDPQEPEPQGIGGHHYLLFTSLFGVIFPQARTCQAAVLDGVVGSFDSTPAVVRLV